MRSITRAAAMTAAALILAGCSGGTSDEPGAVSADEARQLNEAAAMLDANSVSADAVTTAAPDTTSNGN